MDKNIIRVAQIVSYLSISTRSFEKALSVSNAVISRAIKNGTDVSSEVLSQIINTYPQISANWLLTGNGEMLNKTAQFDYFEKKLDEKDKKIEELIRENERLSIQLGNLKKCVEPEGVAECVDVEKPRQVV